MGTINVTTLFDVEDKVFIKNQLDNLTGIEEVMRPFLSFYLPNLLFKVLSIQVIDDGESGGERIIYTLERTIPVSEDYTGVNEITEIPLIPDSEFRILSAPLKESFFPISSTIPGSIFPALVIITNPSIGVKPIEVSIALPSFIAVMLVPPPK